MSAAHKSADILIVDDDPNNLRVLIEHLEAHGFTIAIAQDGEEGLERARLIKPNLILLDVNMPVMDGLETCTQLKDCPETQDIPVMFMTAMDDLAYKVAGFEAGGVDYITKPFQIAEVLARVNLHVALRVTRAQLLRSEQRLLDIAESVSDWFWETDHELRFNYFSSRFFEITKIPPQKLLGLRRWEAASQEDIARDPEKWRRHQEDMENRRPFRDFEYKIHAQDHTAHWSVSGKPFYEDDGTFLGYRGTASDITELVKARGGLLQAEKMASVGKLAAGVAHEINNPVGFVKSNLGSLQRYVQDVMRLLEAYEKFDPLIAAQADGPALQNLKEEIDLPFLRTDLGKLLEESKDGLQRVQQIVRDLKDFSRAGEAEWEQVDLHHCLDSTLNIVWNELKYKTQLVKHYGDLPPVSCIPSQINQVFMNLLVNAADAIVERGKIEINTGCDANEAWVAISDTGAGIPAETIKRIFDPFFTTKPVGKGTGLGLSVSYDIVQKHHGRIEVESTPGAGTTFRVYLPLRRPGVAQ